MTKDKDKQILELSDITSFNGEDIVYIEDIEDINKRNSTKLIEQKQIIKAVNNHQKLVDMVEAYTRRVNVYLKETEATTGTAISVKSKLEHLMQESGKLLKEIENE